MRAAVIGTPVSQSLSPAMHNAVFASLGINAEYGALDVSASDFEGTIERLRRSEYVGLSVTMPHKDAACRISDELSQVARRIGAVNTISFRNGTISGDNTDGAGCVRALGHHGVVVEAARCVVLGAGGTARSVVDALVSGGAREVIVANRTETNARRAIEGLERCRIGDVADVSKSDIVINCTSVGMGTNESPIPAEALAGVGCVLDAVYHPLRTKLLDMAIAAGSKTIDGLWMLVFQAVEQQCLWFGRDVDALVMRSAAMAELARRGNDPTL
ncbi:MAG: shikimate dehydrogenase [Ilumatobacteraceae bacterium]